MMTRVCGIVVLLVVAAVSMPVAGDPLPGEILKFQQLPMNGVPITNSQGIVTKYYGHDEFSTATRDPASGVYQGEFMADDFADKYATPVVHLRWWGSYPFTTVPGGVNRFAIVFESDVPADATNPFSFPGSVLQAQTVVKGALGPASGTFTETLISPGGAPLNEALYQYNAELKVPFAQQPDTVYWLKIVALVDPTIEPAVRWGWHNRDYTTPDPLASGVVVPGERDEQPVIDPTYPTPVWHFQDDAVSGHVVFLPGPPVNVIQSNLHPVNYVDDWDGPGAVAGTIGGNIGQFSKDLAFELYTVPEPVSLSLLVLGGLAVIRRRK